MALGLDIRAREIGRATLLRKAIAAVPPQVLADRIRAARGDATQAEVASKARISASFLSHLENGKSAPSGETLRAIAEATATPVEAFLSPDERPFPVSILKRLSTFSSKHSGDSRSGDQ